MINYDQKNDYNNSVIYIIEHKSDETTKKYIGSSKNFHERESVHKSNCNNINGRKYNYPIYQYIRENGGWSCWYIRIVDNIPCNDKVELKIKEDIVMSTYSNLLNCKKAHNTEEQNKENKKKYREENIEHIKEYRQKNKEQIKENKKEYYEKNLEKIKEYSKEYQNIKIICSNCGINTSKKYLLRHQKSKKCNNFTQDSPLGIPLTN